MLRQDFYRHNGYPDDPNVVETTLMSDIIDSLGRIRYRISMTDTWDLMEEIDPAGNRYLVEVIDAYDPYQPVTVLKEMRRFREEALDRYRECVARYRSLVLSETDYSHELDLRRSCVDYRRCDPECCANCRFSCPVGKAGGMFYDRHCRRGKFICRHPAVAGPDRTEAIRPRPHPGCQHLPPPPPPPPPPALPGADGCVCHDNAAPHDHENTARIYCLQAAGPHYRQDGHGHEFRKCGRHRPQFQDPLRSYVKHGWPWPPPRIRDMYPIVDGDCVCDMYEPKFDPRYRNPRHTRRAFLRHDSIGDSRMDQVVRYEVEAQRRNSVIDANAEYDPPAWPKTRLEHKIDDRIEEYMGNTRIGLINANNRQDDPYNFDDEQYNTAFPYENEFVYIGGGAN